MNLKFVEAFYWAATLESVTQAAGKLHVTQSALSSRIAGLERELGVLLLDRRDRRFRLTGAGKRFQVLALNLLEMQARIKSEMGAATVQGSVLRVGAIESVVHSWLTGWLKHMQAAHPDFALELSVETTPVLVDQLRRGRLDLMFATVPANGDDVHSHAMPSMPMCFVGHRELYQAKRYRLPDLLSMQLLTFQRGSQPQVALQELARISDMPAARVHAISSISAMTQLVEAGFGVAFLPVSVYRAMARYLPFRMLPCDLKLDPLPMFASYRDDPSTHLPEAALRSAINHATHAAGAVKKSMT